jgi:hypothetical protein
MRGELAYEFEVQVDCLGCERAVKEGRQGEEKTHLSGVLRGNNEERR